MKNKEFIIFDGAEYTYARLNKGFTAPYTDEKAINCLIPNIEYLANKNSRYINEIIYAYFEVLQHMLEFLNENNATYQVTHNKINRVVLNALGIFMSKRFKFTTDIYTRYKNDPDDDTKYSDYDKIEIKKKDCE